MNKESDVSGNTNGVIFEVLDSFYVRSRVANFIDSEKNSQKTWFLKKKLTSYTKFPS